MGSPSRAFQPRNPGVMRSPLAGSTNIRPEPPRSSEAPRVPAAPDAVEEVSTTTQDAPQTAIPVDEPVETEAPADAYTTPLPKKRKSRHAPPAEEADTFGVEEEEKKEPSQFEKNAMYGKRYQLMMDTLELAIKTSCDKWT